MNAACKLLCSTTLLFTFATTGCGGSDSSPASGGTSGAPPAASGAAGPAVNLPDAPSTSCATPGQNPVAGQLLASCADQTTIETVADAQAKTFCAGKRFGTFFFVAGTTAGRQLRYCAAGGEDEWFIFGDQYQWAVVVSAADGKSKATMFGWNGGRNFRCAGKQVVSSQPLVLGEELCDGFAVVETGTPPKVQKAGKVFALVPLASGSTAPETKCDQLRDQCCVYMSGEEKEDCDAAANAKNELHCGAELDLHPTVCRRR